MPVGPFSRYRNLEPLAVSHARRGVTRSLPIRRPPPAPAPEGGRRHRIAAFESADLLALRFYGREELFWHLLDANGGRLPDAFEPGEELEVPPLALATRIQLPGR